MLEFMQGDIFEARADIRVNTVNCVGIMGAGVALGFKQRYPEMFKKYQRDCRNGLVKPGKIYVWKSLSGDWVVNFPTKRDWREPSRYEDIDAGLDDLRGYLNTVGPVTVALPALGCGHGGLDWTRVSGMIREKLDGLDAHVLVFEPAASHQAGRTAAALPTNDERKDAVKLGYQLVEGGGPSTVDDPWAPIYVFGRPEQLSRKWIALLPSRAPTNREFLALQAIAAELPRLGAGVTVALVHGTHGSEDVARLFANQGIDTVLLLPFGVLTRKSIAKRLAVNGAWMTLVSVAPANAKWSRQLFAQSMGMLRANAMALLVSDPEPDWLTSKGLDRWARTPISYVRYETTPFEMREALAAVGAKPIGRRSEDGSPNIDHLSGNVKRGTAWDVANSKEISPPERAESAPATKASSNVVHGADVLTISLGELSEAVKRELFDALLRVDARQLDVTVRLPKDTDLCRLTELGFSRKERS